MNTPFTNVIRLDTASLNLGFCSALKNTNIRPKIPAGPIIVLNIVPKLLKVLEAPSFRKLPAPAIA